MIKSSVLEAGASVSQEVRSQCLHLGNGCTANSLVPGSLVGQNFLFSV